MHDITVHHAAHVGYIRTKMLNTHEIITFTLCSDVHHQSTRPLAPLVVLTVRPRLIALVKPVVEAE